MLKNKSKIVVIGGGTGTATVLSALVNDSILDLTAIVAVTDSGGSTGRLRDEFGFIPVGDIRQCLAALATGKNSQSVKDLLLYRFDKGDGLAGHNLGNLILTALTDLYHSPGRAIEIASQILRINGRVYPISEQVANLVINYDNGFQIIGENYLNYAENSGHKISSISLTASSLIYEKAAQALLEADLIILGPGDLYASLLPNTLVDGFATALNASQAPFVYISNLMTCRQQTYQMNASDHLREICRYAGRRPNFVIINQEKITDLVTISRYQKHGYAPLVDDLDHLEFPNLQILRADLIAPSFAPNISGDNLPRNFLRHRATTLHQLIRKILDEK